MFYFKLDTYYSILVLFSSHNKINIKKMCFFFKFFNQTKIQVLKMHSTIKNSNGFMHIHTLLMASIS